MNMSGKTWLFLVLNVLVCIFSGLASANAAPKLLTPNSGSTLSNTATFTWTADGTSLTDWALKIGTRVGDHSLYYSGNLSSGTLAKTASGIPTNGSKVWVRLQWRHTNGSWGVHDVQYATGTSSSTSSPGSTSSPSSGGSVYYVSTSGNDGNAGTQSAPFRTIRFALGRLGAGGTLFIRGGTYTENLLSWRDTKFPSGTSWNTPAKIAAFNGETVNLRGNIDISLATPAVQYVIFDGIRIDATNQEAGIALTGNSHHIRFQNGEVKNAKKWGIMSNYFRAPTFGDTFYEFINMNVHHNGTTKNQDHGFYLKTSRNLVERCHIHNNVAWGIHNYVNSSDPRANNNTYRNNLIHHNGSAYRQGGGITVGSGDNNTVYNNIVWQNFTGIYVHSYHNPVNSGVHHNTVYANQGYGILIDSGSRDADVFNNISFQNYINMHDQGSRTTMSYNLTANPSFVNPSAADFRLRSGSAAIDTGTTVSAVITDRDGRKRPQGNRPDMGAYEY